MYHFWVPGDLLVVIGSGKQLLTESGNDSHLTPVSHNAETDNANVKHTKAKTRSTCFTSLINSNTQTVTIPGWMFLLLKHQKNKEQTCNFFHCLFDHKQTDRCYIPQMPWPAGAGPAGDTLAPDQRIHGVNCQMTRRRSQS